MDKVFNLLRIDQSARIEMAPVKGRIVELVSPVVLRYVTADDGVHEFSFWPGFRWDGRSGPPEVDHIAPNHGTQKEAAKWLGHDGSGYPGTCSTITGNELLRQGLIKDCGYSEATATLIHVIVEITAESWKADDWAEVAPEWMRNKGKVYYRWKAK
jgi:hypothetical protein